MKITVVKNLGNLKPAYDSDYESFKNIPNNEPFEIEYKKKRNIKFHKKFFALINLCYSNQDLYTNSEDLRKDLLILSGYYVYKVNYITGEEKREAKSISFSSMDEIEFTEIYEKVRFTICKWLSLSNEEVEEHIQQYF